MLFNVDFVNNTILPCFISFLIIDLYFLIPAVIALIFNPTSKLVIPIGITIKEVKAEIEIHPAIEEAKIQYNLKLYKHICAFHSSIHFTLFLQVNNLLFHLYFSI